jgi:hypothetical protein
MQLRIRIIEEEEGVENNTEEKEISAKNTCLISINLKFVSDFIRSNKTFCVM